MDHSLLGFIVKRYSFIWTMSDNGWGNLQKSEKINFLLHLVLGPGPRGLICDYILYMVPSITQLIMRWCSIARSRDCKWLEYLSNLSRHYGNVTHQGITTNGILAPQLILNNVFRINNGLRSDCTSVNALLLRSEIPSLHSKSEPNCVHTRGTGQAQLRLGSISCHTLLLVSSFVEHTRTPSTGVAVC